jgi:ADP-ribosyl-[dinitrogen reductase] hydrolase
MLELHDRVLGCLLGGAVGDAWGGSWENHPGPVDFVEPVKSELSDDTQLTMATCESIVATGGVDPEHQAAQYLKWFLAGKITGIGRSTLKAMRDLSAGVHWALAGNRGEFAAGNGSAMRIAPLAFVLDSSKSSDRTVIRDVCRITHHHDEAYVGALAVVVAIRAVLDGTWSRENSFLKLVAEGLPDSAVRDRISEIVSLKISPAAAAARFGATGYVVDTVPLALACAEIVGEASVTDAIAQAIRCGGDTDTIASIAGQLAGTVSGTAAVTQHLGGIVEHQELMPIFSTFAAFVSSRSAAQPS